MFFESESKRKRKKLLRLQNICVFLPFSTYEWVCGDIYDIRKWKKKYEKILNIKGRREWAEKMWKELLFLENKKQHNEIKPQHARKRKHGNISSHFENSLLASSTPKIKTRFSSDFVEIYFVLVWFCNMKLYLPKSIKFFQKILSFFS